MIRHLIDLFDFSPENARDILDHALALKCEDQRGNRPPYLAGRSLGLIFEDVSNPFFSAIHRGVEEVARARSVVTFAGSSCTENMTFSTIFKLAFSLGTPKATKAPAKVSLFIQSAG